MSSNSVCNHTRDKQIGLPLRGRPILLSLVCLQTELDSTQSYYHYLLLLTCNWRSFVCVALFCLRCSFSFVWCFFVYVVLFIYGNRSFRPKSKSFRSNFKVVSFKVICDKLTNYKRNKYEVG